MLPVARKERPLIPESVYPVSPAFVHNYKAVKPPNLPSMTDYCAKKNIPFCAEEDYYYKLN